MAPLQNQDICFRGYVKKENDYWVAICIDLNIVAQGDTHENAAEECANLVLRYVEYVIENHSQEIHKYIPRKAPDEFIEEYNELVSKSIKKPRVKRNRRKDFLNFAYGSQGFQECRV